MGAIDHLRKLRIAASILAYLFFIGKIFLLYVVVNSLYITTNYYSIVPNDDKSEVFIKYNAIVFPNSMYFFIYGCILTFLMSVDTVVGLVAVVGIHLKHKRLLETFFVTALATFVLNFVILFVALYYNKNNNDEQTRIFYALDIVVHRALSLVCILVIRSYYHKLKSQLQEDNKQREEANAELTYAVHRTSCTAQKLQ